ncbi:hypothetical protein GH733_002907 [Mirounga leonina]|nr:hypothetical protein GH733_002907 [Mirounga leonina]
MLWSSGKVHSVDVTTEAFDSGVIDVQSPPTVREEKSANNLAAKLLLLDELVSLENDVIETKKKRSFSGFGSPLDRLSAGSVDHKRKQRKFNSIHSAQFGGQFFSLCLFQLANSSHRLWTQDIASPVMVDLIISAIVIGPDTFHQLSQSSPVFRVNLCEGNSDAAKEESYGAKRKPRSTSESYPYPPMSMIGKT